MHARSSVLAGSAWTLFLFGTMSLLAAEPAGQSGDLWEVTTKMSMEGMPMAGMPMEGTQQMRPSVSIVQPADGSTVTGPNVTVQFTVTNFRIAPAGTMEAGTGHHHLFVDVDVSPLDVAIPAGVPGIIPKGMGQTDHVLEGLAPGRHRLIAVVGDGLHVPINPPMADTVTFTVAP
jgi:hypothetical protein